MASDLLVGAVWIAIAAVLWWPPRTRRSALLAAAFGVTWLAGSVDASLVFLHRGPLAHLLLAYPAGRLSSTPARAAVALAYASAFTDWSLAFALGLVVAVALRWLTATGVVRRSRLVPLLAACGVGAVLAAGALGAEHVLLAYEVVLVLAGVAIAADLRAARWSSGSITGLVVDLGRHGSVRERLARAVGDPTLDVAYVLDAATVDEFGRPVELPANGARVVTPVAPAGETVALLIHDRAVLAKGPLLDGAASVLGLAVTNARLQADVRERMHDVVASTRRLLDASDAERRRLGADLRAQIDPLLADAAGELQAAGAAGELRTRLDGVREELFQLASGLDPVGLRDGGLGPALRELARHAALPATVMVPDERFPPAVESCVWFTCAEAVANALKHARASRLEISVTRRGETLLVEVADDGVGGADASCGSGLRRLADRVATVGGRLAIDSTSQRGTRVVAELAL